MSEELSITVREAERADCESILRLITENSQKEGSSLQITLADLQRDGFDTKPEYFYCLVAQTGNNPKEIVGFAMYFYRYSTWESKGLYLRRLIVDKERNREEIAKILLCKLAQKGVEGDFCRISLGLLSGNESELKFYQSFGALNLSKEEGWLLFSFQNSSVQKILENSGDSMVDKAPNIKVRVAERRDCEEIASLIKELAEFEKMGDDAKLGGEDLARDGFDDPNKYFRAFVAEDTLNNQVIGFSLFFNTYLENVGKSIHLEDFYVTPKYRAFGVGRKLFTAVTKVVNDEGFFGFTLECLDWNTPAIQFYEKHYAENLTATKGNLCCRFRRDVMETLAQKL